MFDPFIGFNCTGYKSNSGSSSKFTDTDTELCFKPVLN